MTELASGGAVFSKGRLEAFSDGVFAVAITLLVFEIAVKPGSSPLAEFLSAWPGYVGYVISFLTIGAAWISHNAITQELKKIDAVFFRLNLLLLLVVVFLPFPTKLVTEAFGDREAERVAATVYGLTLLVIKLLTVMLDRYARAQDLYSEEAFDEEVARTAAAPGPVWCSMRSRSSSDLRCPGSSWWSTSLSPST
jgi:TMEM175 potassium channel family protein